MCTMLVRKVAVAGCGKSGGGWIDLNQANVSWDHPFHAPQEHALNIDFVDSSRAAQGRVAVELSPEGARRLAETIQSVLQEAESRGLV